MGEFIAAERPVFLLISFLVVLHVLFFKVYDERDPAYVSPNERPRFFLAHALADRLSVEVTPEVRRFGWSVDMAERDGHYYSDKPILQSILAAPTVAAYRAVAGDAVTEGTALWLIKATTLAPFALLFFWLFYGAVFSFSRSREIALFSAWAAFFGTPVSTYFTVFFSHSVSATLLLALFLLIRHILAAPARGTLFLAGLLGGAAFLNEYQTALPLAVLSLYLLLALADKRRFLFFIAGALPMALLFIAYNLAAFGTPVTFGVAHETYHEFRAMHRRGLFGIGLPNGHAFLDLLVSLKMGIFLLSPFLLFALVGIHRRWREARRETVALVALIAAYLLMVSSLSNPHGGWAFGARYLVPVVPFLALLAAYGVHHLLARHRAWRIPAMTMALLSCLVFTVANGLRPLVEEVFRNPLANYYLAAVRERYVIFSSLFSGIGLRPWDAFLVFSAIFTAAALYAVSRAEKERPVAGTAVAATLTVILFTLMLLPHHGARDERKFFYWMMIQDRSGPSAAMKEQIFDNNFPRAAEILRSTRHAP